MQHIFQINVYKILAILKQLIKLINRYIECQRNYFITLCLLMKIRKLLKVNIWYE